MKRQIILGHLFPLFFGGLIYISFRQGTLKMFRWFDSFNLSAVISKLRLYTMPISDHLPDWFLYSFPDGLWVFSYLSLLLLVWDNVISKHNIHWLLLVPAIALFSEIGQHFKIVPGTFDVMDLMFYILSVILPIIIFTKSHN